MKALASAHISAKKDSLKIFTDASKLDDNRTAAAIYVTEKCFSLSSRVSDVCSIYAAELLTI